MLVLWWVDYPITPPVAPAADLHQLGCSDERHGVAEPHWGRCIWGIRTCTRQHLPMRTIYMGCLYQVLCSDADNHMYLIRWTQVEVYVQKVEEVQVRGRDEPPGQACFNLLGRLIFLTVVYGRTAVRRRKVDGKICFPTLSEIG